MQSSGHRASPLTDEVTTTFAEQAKAARRRVGLTQQQLSDRLKNEAEVVLDTSAITRIEAGQREPRLGEALAIARVLGFSLNNLVPRADLDLYMSDVKRLMEESRAALIKMIQSVDDITDFARRNPDCLGDDGLEERLHEVIERFCQQVPKDDFESDDQPPLNFAITTTRSDERLKRKVLRAVSEGVLVRADEIQPAYGSWFKQNHPARGRASTTSETGRGWRPVESRARTELWDERFGELLNYVRDHGDARVPRSYVAPNGDRLGTWVVDQRNRFARGTLDANRSARLEQLPGWTWGARVGRSHAKKATAENDASSIHVKQKPMSAD
jgi:transcriptional regulator with XRE-family HTH domain